MAFINEIVSEIDIEKYRLRDINQQYHFALRDMTCRWTVDRERDIYVRKMGTGREEFSSHTTFTFYWKGHLFFWILVLDSIEDTDDESKTVWSLAEKKPLYLPPELEPLREEIMTDFKNALTQNKAASFLIQPQRYSVEFRFQKYQK
jgi:hypothetical protein